MSNDPGGFLGALDPTSDRAVFRQIADRLRGAIDKGQLKEGGAASLEGAAGRALWRGTYDGAQRASPPPVRGSGHGRTWARRVRASTSPRAPSRVDRFARRHREQGKAAFTVEAEAAGSRLEVDSLTITEEKATPEIAARLGSVRKVLARKRRYLLDGRPVEHAISYLPLDVARGTPIAEPNPGPGGIYARLEELGHSLDHFDEEVRARMPTPEEVRTPRLAPPMTPAGARSRSATP